MSMRSFILECSSLRLAVLASLFGGLVSCANRLPDASAASAATQPASASASVLLSLRAFQQTTDYTCGPACVVTLPRYYGRDGDEMQIAKETGTNSDTGTTPQAMASWFQKHGFRVTWGENGSLEMLRGNLARRVPTLVEWIDWGGHWDVVVGYDTRGTSAPDDDLIYFADPSDCTDGKVDRLNSFNRIDLLLQRSRTPSFDSTHLGVKVPLQWIVNVDQFLEMRPRQMSPQCGDNLVV